MKSGWGAYHMFTTKKLHKIIKPPGRGWTPQLCNDFMGGGNA